MNRCHFFQFQKQNGTQSFPGKSFSLLSFGMALCREAARPMSSVEEYLPWPEHGSLPLSAEPVLHPAPTGSLKQTLHLPIWACFKLQDSCPCVGISGSHSLGATSTCTAVAVTQDASPAKMPGGEEMVLLGACPLGGWGFCRGPNQSTAACVPLGPPPAPLSAGPFDTCRRKSAL